MGEIADMIIEGFISEDTGELIDGDAPGYPRRMLDRNPMNYPDQCSRCGKVLKSRQGVKDHMRDVHDQ